MEDIYSASSAAGITSDPNHGWQRVTYSKRQRKPAVQSSAIAGDRPNGVPPQPAKDVFASVDAAAAERRRAIEAKAAAAAAIAEAAGDGSDEEDNVSGAEAAQPLGEATKAKKPKKVKKPKVTVAEAAAKIDADDLAAYLVDISGSYETQQDIQLMRLADYFGRAFASVTASQFPWAKLLREASVSKTVEIPLCHISDTVCKTVSNWLGQKSPEELGDFVIWCMDSIFADLSSQQNTGKGSKKVIQQTPSRSQVAIFTVLSMTLRRKPEVLINLLPKLQMENKYLGQDRVPVMVWIVAQASQGDLVVGLFLWSHYLFPGIWGKSNTSHQSRDLILQLAERILSAPKARIILMNGAVRKGERVLPPSSLELLIKFTFPLPNARAKATERFIVIYPTLKELALAGTPGTKSTKQVSRQLLPICLKAIQENNPELSQEAVGVFQWCLIQNAECLKLWETIYIENVEESVLVLQKMCDEWKHLSSKLPRDALIKTVKNFRTINEAQCENPELENQALFKESEKYCKAILARLTHSFSCLKGGIAVLALAVAVGYVLSASVESSDWEKLQAMFFPPASV